MPSKRLLTGERVDLAHALNNETREKITSAIFTAYEQALAKSENSDKE